jgi:HK97 gp10 family phage protein
MATTNVSGLRELDLMMKQLPAKIEKNIMRGALRAGQKVFAKAAKSNLRQNGSVDTGELEKSVRVRFKRKSEKFGFIRSYVMAGNAKAYYAHWVEYGTATYYTGNGKTVGGAYEITPKVAGSLLLGGLLRDSVMHPGIRPKPFMRPAVDENFDTAVNKVAEYLRKRIPKEMTKAGI